MLKIFAIGIPVTAILCAANLFIGLRGGLTFSAAIPAAVIAAAIFGGAPDKRRLATTTVQSIALPAGTLPEIIFVLPCLVLIGWWQGFPYWETAALCSGGGILGLLVTLPQLSMLADDAALPFPEAVAVAEVIRLGDRGSSKEGRREVARFASAAGAAALFAGLVAINFVANECAFGLRIGRLDSKLGLSFSPALIGAGYLSGAVTGGAILVGLIIAWGIAVPLLTSMHPSDASALAQATAVWSEQVRLIGAGVMAVGAIWTVCRFIGRMFSSYRSAGGVRTVSNNRQSSKAKRDRRSGTSIAALAALVLLAATLAFADERWAPAEVIAMVAAAIAAGALLSGPCGHIAGLIGTSSSPISSIGMLGLMAVVVLTMAFGRSNAVGEQEILALSLFLASGIMAMAALSNGAFEGLKTVRLVDVPLRGQVFALGLGVMVSAAVTPLVLELLYRGYGFAGTLPSLTGGATALAAPQAALMTVIARSLVGGLAHVRTLEVGGLLGFALILAEMGLTRVLPRFRLPVIAVGFGIYLPLGTATAMVLGAAISFVVEALLARKAREHGASVIQQQRRATILSACGLLIGESVVGITAAAVVVGEGGSVNPTSVASWQIVLGLAGVALQCALLVVEAWEPRFRLHRLKMLLVGEDN